LNPQFLLPQVRIDDVTSPRGSVKKGRCRFTVLHVYEIFKTCFNSSLFVANRLFELATGVLPWKLLTDMAEVQQLKEKYNIVQLSYMLPEGMTHFVQHVTNLFYNSKPDYK